MPMTKTVILPVYCAGENPTNVPRSFVAELGPAMITKIRDLAGYVSKLGVYSVTDFYQGGDWSTAKLPDEKEAILALGAEAVLEEAVDVDLPMMEVTRDSVQFSARPKHGMADEALNTATLDLELLEDLDPDNPVITHIME